MNILPQSVGWPGFRNGRKTTMHSKEVEKDQTYGWKLS